VAKTKKVLIVSYAFSPVNAIGAVRISKLAKYLPEFGWQPVVLTADIVFFSQTLPLEIDAEDVIKTPYFYLNPFLNYRRARLQDLSVCRDKMGKKGDEGM